MLKLMALVVSFDLGQTKVISRSLIIATWVFVAPLWCSGINYTPSPQSLWAQDGRIIKCYCKNAHVFFELHGDSVWVIWFFCPRRPLHSDILLTYKLKVSTSVPLHVGMWEPNETFIRHGKFSWYSLQYAGCGVHS